MPRIYGIPFENKTTWVIIKITQKHYSTTCNHIAFIVCDQNMIHMKIKFQKSNQDETDYELLQHTIY